MKREIKFRAWNKKDKEMVDLHKITPLALSDSMNTQLSLQGKSGLFIPFFEEITLMQYTGLKDKNDKEIYEGDIVGNEITGFFEVYWNNLTAGFWIKQATENTEIYISQWKSKDFNDRITLEIIGNIYENSELLEDKNK